MAEQPWFYHVAYRYETSNGYSVGYTTITSRQRLDTDEKFREAAARLTEWTDTHTPRRTGDIVITSITLLAPGVSE